MSPIPTTVQDHEEPSLPPTSLIDDAHTQLSLIFTSSAPYRINEPKSGTGVNEPSLILYCPIEGGESIIDAAVHELALRSGATVKTIDMAQCISKQPWHFWQASGNEGNNSYAPRNNRSLGYFKIDEPISATKLVKVIKRELYQPDAAPKLASQDSSNRRIVYLRDFGFSATLAPVCYGKVLSAVQKPLLGTDDNAHVSTAVILGASPLLVQGGLFQRGVSSQLGRRDSYSGCRPPFIRPGSPYVISPPPPPPVVPYYPTAQSDYRCESPELWGEGKDAEERRKQRLRQQHEMWNNGSLNDHIHKQLEDAGVLTGSSRPGSSGSKCIPTCVVVPVKRDLKQERLAREKRRLELNKFEDLDPFTSLCMDQLVDYDEIKRVADRAIATALASSPDSGRRAPAAISWHEFCAAWKAQEDRDQERANWLDTSTPATNEEYTVPAGPMTDAGVDDNSSNADTDRPLDKDSNDELSTADPQIEKIKREGLNSYEQTLLGCLIRPADIQTGFDSVHLPDTTIDAIRTLVSLRLVCPEAFSTGILKQYNMSGALLFGPPGTGKTHLAKAIAKESGARMISIKPSDILDMYVGEDEKTIDALFKLARRLKPCIIFIDEIDALLGARMAANENKSRWRTDMLTQFTQEMDGMLSSDIVVIGATNRPFDLDDAIIRRLPCRILVDLPEEDAREAILRILLKDEQLESDVSLTDLAHLTPHFSGSDLKHLCVMAAFESVKELANVTWANKKGQEPKPNSVFSSFGVSSPAASDSGKGCTPTPGLTEGLAEPSSKLSSDSDSPQTDPAPQARKLAKRHFTQSLKQVRASTSETQSSLIELRRWNNQFGSGNQSSRSSSGLNLPGSSRAWTNGSRGSGTSGTYSSGTYMPRTNGMDIDMPGTNMSGTNIPETSASLETSQNRFNFLRSVESPYLHSLGVKI
ncbi:hypothetical protein OPQ81_001202 [Rhizoctonia solani]|nr:hypothetical protein OPQ81_001202 [Rhizoctonia solani]